MSESPLRKTELPHGTTEEAARIDESTALPQSTIEEMHHSFVNDLCEDEADLLRELSIEEPRFGKFIIEYSVGRYGQAEVIKAFDPDLGRFVALKIYSAWKTPSVRDAILAEGQALANVSSPFIAKCYSVDIVLGVPVLVMEWVDGQTLDEFVFTNEFTYNEIAAILLDLATGVAEIHKQGLLHRDLKPSNVLIDDNGDPKIIDFGLATGMSKSKRKVVGTYPFMSPEQASHRFNQVGKPTDIFGLGGILYFMLVGRPIYEATKREEIREMAKLCEIVAPKSIESAVPAYLDDICKKCLAKSPQKRYGCATELISDLRKWKLFSSLKSMALVAGLIILLALVPCVYLMNSSGSNNASFLAASKSESVKQSMIEFVNEQMDRWPEDKTKPIEFSVFLDDEKFELTGMEFDPSGKILQLDESKQVAFGIRSIENAHIYLLTLQVHSLHELELDPVGDTGKTIGGNYEPYLLTLLGPAEGKANENDILRTKTLPQEFTGVVEFLVAIALSQPADQEQLQELVLTRSGLPGKKGIGPENDQLRGFKEGNQVVSCKCVPYYISKSASNTRGDSPDIAKSMDDDETRADKQTQTSNPPPETPKLKFGGKTEHQLALEGNFREAIRVARLRAKDRVVSQRKIQGYRGAAIYAEMLPDLEEAIELRNLEVETAIAYSRTPGFSERKREALVDECLANLARTEELEKLTTDQIHRFAVASRDVLRFSPANNQSASPEELIEHLDDARTRLERLVGVDHRRTLDCRWYLAISKLKNGELVGLLDELRELETQYVKHLGEFFRQREGLCRMQADVLAQFFGDFPSAVKKLEQAIEIESVLRSPDHAKTLRLRVAVAKLLTEMGRFEEATDLVLEVCELAAIDRREREGVPNISLVHVDAEAAKVFFSLGNYDRAGEHALIAIQEIERFISYSEARGRFVNRSGVEISLSNAYELLAECQIKKSEFEAARESLKIANDIFPASKNDFYTIQRDRRIATLLCQSKDYESAIRLSRDALEKYLEESQKLVQNRAVDDVTTVELHARNRLPVLIGNLGEVLLLAGEFEEAKGNLLKAISEEEDNEFPRRRLLASWYKSLAIANVRSDDFGETESHLDTAFNILNQSFSDLSVGYSDTESTQLVAELDEILQYSTDVCISNGDQDRLWKCIEKLWMTKGVLFDSFSARHLAMKGFKDEHLQSYVAKLHLVEDRIDNATSGAAEIEYIRELENQASVLRRKIERHTPHGTKKPVGLADVIKRLPGNVAIVEYAHSRDIETDDLKLHAFIISAGKSEALISQVALGLASDVSSELTAFYESVGGLLDARGFREPKSGGGKVELANSFAKQVWHPIDKTLAGNAEINHVIVNPKGLLHGVPWKLLSRSDGVAMIDAPYSISNAVSARDILKSLDVVKPQINKNVLLCGGFKYGPIADELDLASPYDDNEMDFRGWPELPHTQEEIESIEKIVGSKFSVTKLTGLLATEDNILNSLGKSRIVHIASHGCFRGPDTSSSTFNSIQNRFPLLSSGIICSNANLAGEDAYMNASEVFRRDLSDVALVTLSACSSGRGVNLRGQGYLGIEFSVRAAGARASLSSLWPVGDKATKELMVEFYKNYLNGFSKAKSLQLAQQKMRDRGYKPADYGSWFVSGDFR